ncbi:MAG: hypothetical protein QOK11_3317 [Pseudonocardiales bacterium]|nr:hypothetical protein [Pseudonocardiales bacterium]
MDVDEAISGLIRDSGDRLLRLAFQLCHDRSTAEDIVQQALEQVYRRWLRGGDEVRNPEAYARRAVVNEFLRRRRLASASELVTDAPPEGVAAAADAVLVERDVIWRALSALPPRQRAALVLRYYEDLADRDIAEVLGCRQATVRSLIVRGLRALQTTSAPATLIQGVPGD